MGVPFPIHHPLMLKAAIERTICPSAADRDVAMRSSSQHGNVYAALGRTPISELCRSAPWMGVGMFEFASGHFAEQKSDAYSNSDGDKRIALNALFEACFERHYLILSPRCRLS